MVLQYQYNIKQTRGENKEKYQLGVRRITNEILVVKGLSRKCDGLQ